eukprot:757624-Hanusia_phi.AAC.1
MVVWAARFDQGAVGRVRKIVQIFGTVFAKLKDDHQIQRPQAKGCQHKRYSSEEEEKEEKEFDIGVPVQDFSLDASQ